jgi:predicted dehydrogenase
VSTSNQIRVGIAGLGRSGWDLHAKPMGELPEKYKVVAAADLDPARQQEAVDKFGCRAYDSFDSLLGDNEVELLVVATPTPFHAPHSIAALKAGRNVVSEKPVALSVAQYQKVLDAAKSSGKMYAPYQNLRFEPSFGKIREVIDSGVLGRIVEIRISIQSFSRRWDWQTLREMGGGQLNNTGPHFLDQALVLFGDHEPQVFCRMDKALASGDAEDHVKVILSAKGAPLIDLEISATSAYKQDAWQVSGTKGGLKSDRTTVEWKTVDFSKMPPRPIDRKPTPDRSYNSEPYDWKVESWTTPADTPTINNLFYRSLYETFRNGKPLTVTPEFVMRQIRVNEECHRQGGY